MLCGFRTPAGIRPADQDVSPAWARVSYVRELPDGRRFANDSRGFLYLIDQNNRPQLYADVSEAFPYGVYNRLESVSSDSSFIRSLHETVFSTPFTPNAAPAIQRRPISSRLDSR